MKRGCAANTRATAVVAPLAGAWIETPPIRGVQSIGCVAPLAGAWIETLLRMRVCIFGAVAPLAGAWIETMPPTLLQLPE